MAIIVKKFPFNPFPVNTYVVYDDETKETAIIDAGCYWAEEKDDLKDFIESNKLNPKYLLLTHLHLDHALCIPYVKKVFNIPFYANKKDEFLLQSASSQAASFGLKLEYEPIAIDYDLKEGDPLSLGKYKIEALEVPGHSPGSIVYYIPDADIMFAGDVLFRQSIGRTDLPGGNFNQLIDGINKKLMTLPDNTIVYSGHGPETSVGYEKQFNQFL